MLKGSELWKKSLEILTMRIGIKYLKGVLIMDNCRACGEREAKVGVFCCQCMKKMREFRKKEKEIELYYLALGAGAGDLWREHAKI